jgi:hypothetical protein
MHFPEGSDHRQIHHGPGFGINGLIAPTESPTPSCHGLLKGAIEIVGIFKDLFDIFCTKGAFALGKSGFEHIVHCYASSSLADFGESPPF